MKKHLPLLFACLLVSLHCCAQGCVTVRSLTGFGQFSLPQYNEEPVKWLVNANSRYSEFHDTYQGSEKQAVPPEDQTFSSTYIMDFVITRIFENGWSVSFEIPFMYTNLKTWK